MQSQAKCKNISEPFNCPFFDRILDPPGPVDAVLRRTRPNATCIPNRTGSLKKDVKPDNFLKLNDPVFRLTFSCVSFIYVVHYLNQFGW